MGRNLLVVGAQEGSIGKTAAKTAEMLGGWEHVLTAGLSGEDVELDITNMVQIRRVLGKHGPFDDVVCTAGINASGSVLDDDEQLLVDMCVSTSVNFHGHIYLLKNWVQQWNEMWGLQIKPIRFTPRGVRKNFVSISSNSAHVARSTSLAYCASKAALSMAMRCAGRELAAKELPFNVYAYEPGWVEDTPMSEAWWHAHIADDLKPHRIPGGEGLNVYELAGLIINNLKLDGRMFNGTCIRVDGGEQ